MFFYAATGKQPVATLTNGYPVAANILAAQSERERRFLLITGEINCVSTAVIVSPAGRACKETAYCPHAPSAEKNSRCRQPYHPLRNTFVVELLDYCLGTLGRCFCKLLLLLPLLMLLTVACRANLYRRNISFEISRLVGRRTEILARQAGKGHLFEPSSETKSSRSL